MFTYSVILASRVTTCLTSPPTDLSNSLLHLLQLHHPGKQMEVIAFQLLLVAIFMQQPSLTFPCSFFFMLQLAQPTFCPTGQVSEFDQTVMSGAITMQLEQPGDKIFNL